MLDMLLGTLSGDSVSRQHLFWLLSHPAFWFVLVKWGLFVLSVVFVSARLIAAKRLGWLLVFLLFVVGVLWSVHELSQQVAQSYTEGHSRGRGLLQTVGLLMDVMIISVAVWVLRGFSKRRQ